MFAHTWKLILILTLLSLKDNLVSCGYSKCLKLPHHDTQLTLYKDEVNIPSNLKTSVRIGDDGEKLIVFEFEVPQKGVCFWEEQVCLTSPLPQNQSCDKYKNQSMWFVLPFHNYFRTYKVTSLVYDGDNDNDYTGYTWTSANHCAILFQEEEGNSLCLDFEHALLLEDEGIFPTDIYDFKSVLLQPGCQLMQYVIGEWQSAEMEEMVEFSEEITQYYCHCEDLRKFDLGVTTTFPPNYVAEKISVPWVWDGTDVDDREAVAANTPWEANAVLSLSEDKRSIINIKGVLIMVMIIAVVDTLILGLYIWMGDESSWEEDEDV